MNSTDAKISISVLTPSWNRADFLARVWQGLNRQSDVSFEWIVGNDGSSDATSKIVADLAQCSSYPIILIEGSVRTGKSCIDNLLVEAARGEFVIWCDSDDVLNPDALYQLLTAWEDIPAHDRNEYMGVSARAETVDGVLGQPFSCSVDGCSWNEVYSKLKSDLTIMARADLVKKMPFLEVDFLIPETSIWNVIGTRKTKFVDRALKTVHYGQAHALSFTGKMQYNRGRAHAIGQNHQYVKADLGLRGEFFRGVNFIRYCAHGDVPFSTAIHIWSGSLLSHCMLAVGLLPALMLVIRDRIRGVVEKTRGIL